MSSDVRLTCSFFFQVEYLAGVSVCADGDVGRDFYVIIDGGINVYEENEELLCSKNPADCICMAARYPPPAHKEYQGRSAASSIDFAQGRSASVSVASDRPGFGKCVAVSTAQTRLLHLTREKWVEFQKQFGPSVCDRIYPLLVEPSESLAKINFFRGISARMLQNIGLMFRTVFLRKDEILFEELSSGHSLFIVSKGTAKVRAAHEIFAGRVSWCVCGSCG